MIQKSPHQRGDSPKDFFRQQDLYWVLFLVGFFSMFVLGYQFGVTGRRNFWMNFVLSIIFALVMLLIPALDRPELSLVKVSQNSMVHLQQELHAKQLDNRRSTTIIVK